MSAQVSKTEFSFETRLKQVIKERFKNYDEAAQTAKVTKTTLQRALNGQSTPKISMIGAIAEAADVSLDWLILGKGPKRHKSPDVLADIESQARRMKQDGVQDSDLDTALEQGLEPAVMDRTILAGIFSAYLESLGDENPTQRADELLRLHDETVEFLRKSSRDGVLDKDALKRFLGTLAGR